MQDHKGGSPPALPKGPEISPRTTEEHSPESPQFAHLASPKFKNILVFAPFECPKIPRKHQRTSKKSLFLPLFSLFWAVLPLLSSPQAVRLPSSAHVLPECSHSPGAALPSKEAGSPQGKRNEGKKAQHQQDKTTRTREQEREKRKAEREAQQAHNERGTPPWAADKTLLPSTIFRAKKSAKSHLGSFEKIFGKIFRGNVSGVRKTPCVISTEGGMIV